MALTRGFACPLLALSLAACADSRARDPEPGSDAGVVASDASRPGADSSTPPPPPVDAGPPVTCEGMVCPAGQVCCPGCPGEYPASCGEACSGRPCLPPPTDAGPAPLCEIGPPSPRDPDQLCYSFAVVGEPFTLTANLFECYCGETFSCAVRVEGDVVDLDVEMCSSAVECDGCIPGVVACTFTPPRAGTFEVRSHGQRLTTLEVLVGPPPPIDLGTTCVTPHVSPTGAGLICPFPGVEARTDQVCFQAGMFPGPSRLTLTDSCGSCFQQEGPCDVQAVGSQLVVTPRAEQCDCPTCGGCATVCMPRATDCLLPPELVPGSYRLQVGLTDWGTVEIGGGAGGGWCAGMTSGGGGGSGGGTPGGR